MHLGCVPTEDSDYINIAFIQQTFISDDPSTPERCAIITGTREQIFKANQLIAELIRKSAAQGQGAGADTFFMHVTANKTGLVIGKGGETIKQVNSFTYLNV